MTVIIVILLVVLYAFLVFHIFFVPLEEDAAEKGWANPSPQPKKRIKFAPVGSSQAARRAQARQAQDWWEQKFEEAVTLPSGESVRYLRLVHEQQEVLKPVRALEDQLSFLLSHYERKMAYYENMPHSLEREKKELEPKIDALRKEIEKAKRGLPAETLSLPEGVWDPLHTYNTLMQRPLDAPWPTYEYIRE